MSYVGLLDCNNFFVSCERLFRPDLVKRPVAVLSSNDGCIVARSQEVKDLGIPMGIPHFKVRSILEANKVVVFSSNFQLYRDISRRVMEVLESMVGPIEQYSVDEAFFEIKVSTREVKPLLRDAKVAIEQSVGVPVSLGAGKTMTIAKYANSKSKKTDRTCFLHDKAWQKETTQIPISSIWSVGRATSRRMNESGIKTVADLLAADRERVDRLFGVHGLRLQSELSEVPARSLSRGEELQKSIMSTRSFAKASQELSVLENAVSYHTAYVAKELRELCAKAKVIRVLLRPSRHGDWSLRGGSLEALLTAPTDDTKTLLHEALNLTRQIYEAGVPYKKAGVILSGITAADSAQPDLFTTSTDEQSDKLDIVIDAVNDRFGKDSLTIGRLKNAGGWRASRQHASPQYTTKWSDIASVKSLCRSIPDAKHTGNCSAETGGFC